MDSIPVLAKSGAILPLSNDKGNSVANPVDLELQVYNGNNTYTLYEDNELGSAAYTKIENSEEYGKENVKLSFSGDFSVLPKKRDITLTFKSIVVNTSVDGAIGLTEKQYADVTVTKNGAPIPATVSKYGTVKVKIEDIDYSASYEVTVEYSVMPALQQARRDVFMKLLLSEGAFSNRTALYNKIKQAESVGAIVGMIENSDLSAIEKIKLSETFTV